MKRIASLAVVCSFIAAVSAAGERGDDGGGASKPIPDWFTRRTGLGLSLHWGPWSAKFNSTCGWSLFRGKQTCREFAEDLGPRFRAERYDPDKWMKAAC